MKPEIAPFEVPHPSEFIQDELDARGWTRDDLAKKMPGRRKDKNKFVVDMYFIIGPEKTNCRIGKQTAAQFGKAFGISAEFFLNLEAAWLKSKGVEV